MIEYIDELEQVLRCIKEKDIDSIVSLIDKASRVYVIGNGGSQANADHFVTDLVKLCNKKAYSMSNSSLLTMISNDFDYVHGFYFLLSTYCSKGDVVFAMTTSGKSGNIVRAMGNNLNVKTVLITGSGGKELAESTDASIVVPSLNIQILEDIFLILCHLIALKLREVKNEK